VTLPTTVATVAELVEVLSHLPQDMKVMIDDDALCACNVGIMMDSEWFNREFVNTKEDVIKLHGGDQL
jgi:hypothetical protein